MGREEGDMGVLSLWMIKETVVDRVTATAVQRVLSMLAS